MGSALRNYAVPDNVVAKSLYDANSLLIAVSDNDPAAVAIAASRFVGRKATGDPGVMTPAEALALLSGATCQVQYAQTGDAISGNTILPADDTIPQKTEGFEVITCAITPKATGNILLVIAVVQVSHYVTAAWASIALFQDDGANAIATAVGAGAYGGSVKPIIYKTTAANTSETTFKVRCGPSASGTVYVNTIGGATGRTMGGLNATTLTIIEFVA